AVALIGARRFADDPFVGGHVAGHTVAVSGERPAPVDAGLPGVLSDATRAVDDVQLALVAALVRCDQAPHHLGSWHALAQQLQTISPVVRVNEGLGRKRADAAFGVRAQGAGGEEARRDGDAERADRKSTR